MDVRNGDVLAMSTLPTYNPNHFIEHPPQEIWSQEYERWTNQRHPGANEPRRPGVNTRLGPFLKFSGGNGRAGTWMGPGQKFLSAPPGKHFSKSQGAQKTWETPPPGQYNFARALALSCNYYFYTVMPPTCRSAAEKSVGCLGPALPILANMRTGFLPRQEDRGYFPTQKDIASRDWHLGNTANMSIGQDKVSVTPLQIACMISAVANGGTVILA